MSEKVRVADAAKKIGCAPQFLRERMRKGEWDLGTVVKSRKADGKYSYFIFQRKLDIFLGMEGE